MITPAQVRKHALSLEGAHEEPHFDRTSFRVDKRIFATMTADGAEAMVKVKPQDKLEALLETSPEVFFSYGGFTRMGALGVRLAAVDPALMRDLLTAAWRDLTAKKPAAKKPAAKKPAAKKPAAKKKKARAPGGSRGG